MPLGERIKELRKETSWSQGELAEKVGTDARQISRYENGRITPSLDVLARIAETLNVSLDHLVFDEVPRRPLHASENVLGERLATIAELDEDDRHSLLNVIDGLVTKSRIKALASGVS
jgi:transcriptional regulator with XRE-family HTH domain